MTEKPHILIVDDEPAIRLTLETGLSLKGFRISSATNGREAVSLLKNGDFDAVICDLVMPDGDGYSVVRELREFDENLPVILITAQGSVEAAYASIEMGASDFIAKPFEITQLAALAQRLLEARREKDEQTIKSAANLPDDFSASGLIGRSPPMVAVYKLVAFAARSNATVLITGETGTGKELVARAVHDLSDRARGKFVSVNCSGLTETLLEAELFGYEKGAFTGAEKSRAGLFEAADGGTIFLDELASTSVGFQASLLRVLQSGEIRRVGATETKKIDVRVVGSSNEQLRELAESGQFRADLFYRLSVLTIELPPLRERRGDVPLLVNHFLQKLKRDTPADTAAAPHLTQDVSDALLNYDFPGNVRELENALVRAVALSTGKVITLDCLPPSISAAAQAKENSNDAQTALELVGDRPSMEELQRRYLSLTLAETNGNRRRAAEKLGLDRRTIQRLIARYNLFAAPDEDAEEADGESVAAAAAE
jgi:DNA-binding NtrC family response regulator